MLSEEERNARYEKQRQAAQRQRERQQAKMADPAYRQHKQEERRASAQRTSEKQLARLRSPEYQAQQREKQRLKRQEAAKKPRSAPVKKSRPTSTRGLKGRPPTADERRVMNALARLPCIPCWLHAYHQPIISLHHVDGRTAPDAHRKVIPLCNWHHQIAAPKDVREKFPWLVPVHACGSVGGKAEFTRLNASEEELLRTAYEMAGLSENGAEIVTEEVKKMVAA